MGVTTDTIRVGIRRYGTLLGAYLKTRVSNPHTPFRICPLREALE
jgi:hypothetical protein